MKEKPKSILIVKLSAIGDVVHSLPVLEVLRKNFPGARIDWLVEEEASQIIEGHEALDHVIVSNRKSWQRRFLGGRGRMAVLRELLRFLRELRSVEYDLLIDLHGLLKSGILIGLSRAGKKVGFSGGSEGSSLFLTERPYPVDYNQHALDRYLKMADYLGCNKNNWKGLIPVRASDKMAVDEFIRKHGIPEDKMVAIHPMARWETKLWENRRFSSLADRLQEELSCRIIFTGNQSDQITVNEIMEGMEGKAVDLTGKIGLKELAHLYSRCRLLVTTDTGPMHIAAAMGCPVVALFGPTAPWRTGPYGENHRIIREGLDCSPCFKKRCDHMSCMKDITVERVVETVKEFF